MATIDDIDVAVSHRLKAERQARDWSIADLAERSGVSKAMISKIERGEVSPTAALLVRLASAFGLTLATLLARAERASDRVSRAADQALWTDPGTGYTRRQLLARDHFPLELADVELPPGAEVRFPAASYTFIRQALWILAGRLTIVEGGQRYPLDAGDCFAFGAPADVAFINETNAGCRYLVVVDRR